MSEEEKKDIPQEEEQQFEADSFIAANYGLPEDRDGFIDTSKGEVIEKKEMTPFDTIKAIAQHSGVELRDPKGSCKHCYGRGYVGKDSVTKAPIPCACIYPPLTDAMKQQQLMNEIRNGRAPMSRRQKKMIRRAILKEAKKKAKVERRKKKEGEDGEET